MCELRLESDDDGDGGSDYESDGQPHSPIYLGLLHIHCHDFTVVTMKESFTAIGFIILYIFPSRWIHLYLLDVLDTCNY